MQYDVFISYSRKDSEVANRICKAFDEVGITYFIDRQGISGGADFTKIITSAIKSSSVFLFLASKNAYSSKYTNKEVNYAIKKKEEDSLIPYIIDDSDLPDELEFVFSNINWRRLEEHPINTTLVDDLLRRLGKIATKKSESVEESNIFEEKKEASSNGQSYKDGSDMSMDEIFSNFGDVFGGSGSKGTDLRVRLKLSPQEMQNGTTKNIKFKKLITCSHCHGRGVSNLNAPNSKCSYCNGEGIVNGEEMITINIPKGSLERETITINGKGNAGKRNGLSGNLLVVFESKSNINDSTNTINGHEYVDLGLSVKWATCNIGANSPEEFGEDFAWGEVEMKDSYTEENYKLSTISSGLLGFKSRKIMKLDAIAGHESYDAARTKWGANWRLPTQREVEELKSKCKWIWTVLGKHQGYRIIGPNKKSIFLPAKRWLDSVNSVYRIYDVYWTATPSRLVEDACALWFNPNMNEIRWFPRSQGCSIRPVVDLNNH